MTRSHFRRVATIAASLLVPACGLIVGIDPDLDVKAVADAASPIPDTSFPDGFKSPPVDANPALPPPQRPPEGVYVYDVMGFDKLTGAFPFPVANYGPTATVTITYIGTSCFEQKLSLRTGYDEVMRLCIINRDIVQDQGTRNQRFNDFISASTTVKCVPGDVYLSSPLPAAALNHDCTGNNTDPKSGNSSFRTRGTYTYLGDTTLTVMGQPVTVNQFFDDRSVSLSQTGSNIATWYFAVDDGTLQKLTRKVNIDYDSPVGKIHYSEDMTMTLKAKPGPADAGTDG